MIKKLIIKSHSFLEKLSARVAYWKFSLFNCEDDILKKSGMKIIETAKVINDDEIIDSTVLLWLSTIISFKKYVQK